MITEIIKIDFIVEAQTDHRFKTKRSFKSIKEFMEFFEKFKRRIDPELVF
jgi:hypothetical protein